MQRGTSRGCSLSGCDVVRACLVFVLIAGTWVSAAWAQNAVVLVGSGSSVPVVLYNRWAVEYNQRTPHFQMRYMPTGASEGIKQISRGVGDFAAGEVPLTTRQRSDEHLTDIPVAVIAIVPIYNLPALEHPLKLSGEVLADIYLGNIKTWNHAQIAQLNPDVTLPNLPIKVVQRRAGKGSNYVFTDFLSKSSPKFRAQIGTTASPDWPVGTSTERSADMAEKVGTEAGAIGYVELQYALKGGISQAAVKNPAGKFVTASKDTIMAACRAVEEPSWDKLSVSLTDAPGARSYPITSFTWIYTKTQSNDAGRETAMKDFLSFIFRDGQRLAGEEGYLALPDHLLKPVRAKLQTLR